jgi:hypothetical protein
VILIAADIRVFAPTMMAITAIGILYFYITLRGPGHRGQAQGAVVLRGCTAAAIITMFAGAIDLALPNTITPEARAVIQQIFSIASGLTMVICFAAAVFYAGAISPALIIRKTLVFSATVALLLFLFAVAEIYIAHMLIHALHVNDSFVSAVLGAIFGLAFHPLKHRIEHLLKRFAPKDKACSSRQRFAKAGVEYG